MRRLIRTTLALAMVGALWTLTAATVAAGNYAETSIVDGADTPPTAGEQRELRVLLLQHGVTPVDHGTVELTAWLPGTDERISVMAASVGGGEWVANVTFPVAGDWAKWSDSERAMVRDGFREQADALAEAGRHTCGRLRRK